MKSIVKLLHGDFNIMDIGCAKAADIIVPQLRKTVTIIEVDPITPPATTESEYFNKIVLSKAVSGTCGKKIFHKRKYGQCSSFLEIKPEIIKAYNLENYTELIEDIELECETLQTLLSDAGIDHLDYLKTS